MRFKYLFIVLIVLIAIVIGFMLENLKVNINYILETGGRIPTFFEQDKSTRIAWLETVKVDAPYDYYHNHRRIESLLALSETELIRLKWLVTFVFVGVFMLINGYLMRLITGEKKYLKWTILLYALFFGISFAIYLFGKLTGTSDQAYGVSRKIVGALQSLVPLMLLLPASWLMNLKKNQI